MIMNFPPVSVPRDLSRIDTPEKAAQVPVMHVPILSMLNGALNGPGRLDSVELQMQADGQTDTFGYHATPEGLQASGTVGAQPFEETWIRHADGGVDIEGRVGANEERLHAYSDARYWHLDGRIGDVDVHEKGFITGTEGDARYVLDGTIGNEPAHSEIYGFPGAIIAYGYVGGETSTSSLKTQPTADPSTLDLIGQGTAAGTSFTLTGALHLELPAPPPAPPPPAPTPPPPDLDIPTPDWDPVLWPPE